MTPEQREAAIERMANTMGVMLVASDSDAESIHAHRRSMMAAALDALLSEFVVLHRDDVTEERADLDLNREPDEPSHRRLCTRWEPITNEGVGPWTTQETP